MHVFLVSQQKVEPSPSTEPGLGRRRDVSQPEASSSSPLPLLPRRFCRCHYCRCYDLKIASNAKKKTGSCEWKKGNFSNRWFSSTWRYAASIFANLDWLNYSLFFFSFCGVALTPLSMTMKPFHNRALVSRFRGTGYILNLRRRFTDYHTWRGVLLLQLWLNRFPTPKFFGEEKFSTWFTALSPLLGKRWA